MEKTNTAPQTANSEMKSVVDKLKGNFSQYGIVVALLVIIAFFQVATGGLLLAPNSLVALVQQNTYVFVLAIGMVMVIVATHIDLSVGSQVAFVGGIAAILMSHLPANLWFLSIPICIFVGILIGIWQGFWVAYVGIPGFIVTLAGMLLFRGFATVLVGESVPVRSEGFKFITKGYLPNIFGFAGNLDVLTLVIGAIIIGWFGYSQVKTFKKSTNNDPFMFVGIKIALFTLIVGYITYLFANSGNEEMGGIPITLVLVAFLVAIYTFIMGRTKFGRHIYAVGGNRKAAVLSGIDAKKVDFKVFIHMGVLAAIAAIAMLSRLASASAQTGDGFELDAIAACFIGGVAVSGGVGKIPNAMIGALVMGVLNQGLSIMGVSSAWVKAIKGIVLLVAVALDVYSKRKKA
ncbi:putative multiple sugar transport system permease protein [Pilibacter termitis]|uniref:Xylose transport system permease protein XylH n=1 Tax=Pilibacter termitis TaxID=263852 RepID=A0A1T4R217_9ENTE|nr:sugar ABC transporter permease [Pilibacter termitis]SKA09781.1 putative multiple sugar transport system permease protein [Pilibacter termitis]